MAEGDKPLDDNAALREMAKHAHRALNAAANILATLDEDMVVDESVEDVRKRCADIACSLFTLLRGNEIDRYESAPFASAPPDYKAGWYAGYAAATSRMSRPLEAPQS